MQPVSPMNVILARLCAIGYFGFFWLMPFYTRWERVKPVPERVVYHAH